jgi:hypothetical protein
MAPMNAARLRSIVIVGGGTAGWMAAAALSRTLEFPLSITLIESEDIGTVGVGEATVPHLRMFNDTLRIDEIEFVRAVRGTFKLGIQFVDWGRIGDRYIHGFGTIGHEFRGLPFHQFWTKLNLQGKAHDLGDYSLNTAAAPVGRFMAGASDVPTGSPLAQVHYAYHFEAGLYARYLRRSSTVRASAACSSSSISRPATTTGRTGCPATAPSPYPARRPAPPRPTRDPPRAPRGGNGASRCSIAPATATCIRARTSATTKRRPRCSAISMAARSPSRAY